jgi:hypothetical protein
MPTNRHTQADQDALTWVALFEYNDRATWTLAVQVLESAGLAPIFEASLGWLEVSVSRKDMERARTLLKSEARLAGKKIRWSE